MILRVRQFLDLRLKIVDLLFLSGEFVSAIIGPEGMDLITTDGAIDAGGAIDESQTGTKAPVYLDVANALAFDAVARMVRLVADNDTLSQVSTIGTVNHSITSYRCNSFPILWTPIA